MKRIIKQLFWALPSSVHTMICKLTGYRLVKVTDASKCKGYVWSKKYPL